MALSAEISLNQFEVVYALLFKMADCDEDLQRPKVVFVFSGKRKSGKDFVAKKLEESLGCDKCVTIRLSGPLKHEYARQNGLDFHRLLDSSTYKERFRQDMIRWGEEKRIVDPSFFLPISNKNDDL